MRLLSFRAIYVCIFLPPVLYIFTLQGLESYLEHTWDRELKTVMIQNREALQQGRLPIQQEIQTNVESFIDSRRVTELGAEIKIRVRTAQGRPLYPDPFLEDRLFFGEEDSSHPSLAQLRNNIVAFQNRRIMQEGLVYNVSVWIPRQTWLANIVLLFYIFAFAFVLYLSYHSRILASDRAVRNQHLELESTRKRLQRQREKLESAREKQAQFQQQVNELQNKLQDKDSRLRSTEEEALAELEDLEQKMAETVSERETREREIQDLLQQLEHMESGSQFRVKKQERDKKQYSKRFQTLYKKLVFRDRALVGFAQLPENLKLKAEEIIHNLDSNPWSVNVKRKVFSQNGVTILETEFANKGRLYWRYESNGKIEIVSVGTKNTQLRDLKYIETLESLT